MKNLTTCLAVVCTLWVCSVTSAQDRGFASAVEWSPDGETIAIASDKGVWFFDTEFNELGVVEFWEDLHIRSPRSLSWNAAGDLIAIAYPLYSDREHPVQIIDATRYEVLTSIEVLALWTQVVWHPADNLIAAGTWSGETLVLDALTGEVSFYFQEQESDKHPRIYSNSTLAVCWFSKSVIAIVTQWETYIVDVELNEILQSFDIRNDYSQPECDGERKIISAQEGIFHLEIGALSESFRPWRNDFSLVERLFPESREFAPRLLDEKFSPDGNRLVTIAEGCVIKVFDIRSGRLLAHIRGGLYFVQFPYSPFQDVLAWHPDGSRFAAVGQFGGVRIWDGKTYELLQQYDGFESGYGEISESLDNYSEEELHQIEAFKHECIEAVNSKLPTM